MEVSGKKTVFFILFFGVFLGMIALLGKPEVRLKPLTPKIRTEIAVLPFVNLEGDTALELIASNVTVAIIDALSELEDVRVMTYAATLVHKDLAGGAEQIAKELGADYVLAGSIERVGIQLRLQAYFVKPGRRPRIWADEFFYREVDEELISIGISSYIRESLTAPE